MKIKSVRSLLKKIYKHAPDAQLFRGQADDWPVLPKIGRYNEIVTGYDNWHGFHEFLISRFQRLGSPMMNGAPSSEVDWWIHGQHHGLPTRLLDCSTNPMKSLWFSVNDVSNDKSDGVLWSITFGSWREDLGEKQREHWDTELCPFFPRQLNPRVIAQEGCFICYPLPDDCCALTPANKIAEKHDCVFQKFIVPAQYKPKLRRELDVLGVQFHSMFPDLDGVANSIMLRELLTD